MPVPAPTQTTAARWGPKQSPQNPATIAVSRQTSHGDGPLPEQRQYRPAGRAQPVPGSFPLGLGKQKLAPYVFEKDMIDEAMAMVQKHIAKINQIVYYEEMHRGILGLYNDLTIWTTKLFREMLGKIKADATLRLLEKNGRLFLSERIGTYKDLFKAELYLLDKESGRLDEVHAIRFARAVASLMEDITNLKEMRLDGQWY